MQLSRVTLVVLWIALPCIAADKPSSDPNKLPVGSVWEGTYAVENGKKSHSGALTIKITKRDGNKIAGEWIHGKGGAAKVGAAWSFDGTIAANNRITVEWVKVIDGKPRDDAVGNARISGQLGNDGLEGTALIPETKWTMTWNAKLKKD